MKKIIVFLVIICFMLTACAKTDINKSRVAWLSTNNEDIVIGLSYPVVSTENSTGLLKGINMAVEEINRNGVLGKQIRIQKEDDEGSVTIGAELAQSFVNDPTISAVIGHWNSRVSNAVADIYNRNGMVMITPASTSPLLTSKGYEYVFSIINDDIDYGSTMARYAGEEELDKVVIYYTDDDYGRGLANAFEDAAYENEIEVVDRITSINQRNIQELITKWDAFGYNAIFIADLMPSAAEAINIIRSAEIRVPIIGSTGLDRITLTETLGNYAEGIAMPTVYNPTLNRPEMKSFLQEYEKQYGTQPDFWAIQGYETVKILAHAMEAAGSAMPEQIAAALSKIECYKGVQGDLTCNSKGEIVGSKIYVKIVEQGEFHYVGKY